ncbi:zinc finger CCCH domain-containing protein 1-like [Hordeum vulgare subsp. vulgare]|uniref:C3H1-type domain-containing protein n=1 Tax=Hordeum vulgare subsp. vulgare TaxID=112509 RepID=A0A8I6X3W7_HORVV|nr:zinc finger CCCH domain-containing protein 1-like [Hordeum vulgare subsp. vulgare]KAI5005535.1 hypothetical protein ZWY2020_032778 [Hordeum vulgare]
MEGEDHAAANAFNGAPTRRWAEDVIVLSSGRPPRSVEAVVVVNGEADGQGQHEEAPPERLYFKTRLCEKYEVTGRCMYEDACTFAHGRAELRPPVPPPSHAFAGGGRFVNGGGKVCFNFRDTGACHFGDKCAFPHAAAPATPGHAIRLTGGGDQRVLTDDWGSATPPARQTPGPRYAAPGSARAYPYPPVLPRDRLGQTMPEENGGKKPNRLMLMSQGKIAGIYGDWLDEED